MRPASLVITIALFPGIIGAQTSSGDLIVLKNDSLRLTFTHDGRLKAFTPARYRDNYLKAVSEPPPLIDVTIGNSDGSAQIKAVPSSPRISVARGMAVIESESVHSFEGEIPVAIRILVQLATGSAESRWTVTLSNRDANRTVFAVTLPRISGVCLGPASADDSLYLPYWGGERFPHAIQDFADIAENRLSALEGGSRRVTKEDGRYIRELTYAGGASMMWLDYVDQQHGLYLASYDPEFLVTVLHADREISGRGGMNFEFRKWVTIAPGHSSTLAPFIVAARDNDWHSAADRYRSWFRTQVPVSLATGEWRERVAGWMPFLKNAYGRIAYRFSDLPGLWQQERKLGMDLIDPYGWSRGGFDSQYPEYYPDLDLGGPAEMARAWRQIREGGGQIVTYINARIFNRRSLYFPTLGEEAAARKPDGSYTTETYSPGSPESFVVMCPGSLPWQKLLTDFGTVAITQYGSQLIYYDQIAAARPMACYSPRHGHRGPELWNQEYRNFLRQAAETDRKRSPDAAFMIEGAADLYAPFAHFQGYFCPRYAGTKFAFPELLKYTFPELIQANFFLNTRNPPNAIYPGIPTLPHDVAIYWLARDILLGKLFFFMDPMTEDGEWWQEVAHLLAVRRAAAPWIGNGVFRDTLDVSRTDASVEVKTYEWKQEGKCSVLAAILNSRKKDGAKISIHDGRLAGPFRAFRLEPDGSKINLPVTVVNGDVTFACSPDLLWMVVIEGKCLMDSALPD